MTEGERQDEERYCGGCRTYYVPGAEDAHEALGHQTVTATELAPGVRVKLADEKIETIRTVWHRYAESQKRWNGDVEPIPAGSVHVSYMRTRSGACLLKPGTYEIVRD